MKNPDQPKMMIHHRQWRVYFLLLLTVWLLACTKENEPASEVNTTKINHVVLVWFKADTQTSFIDQVMKKSQKLKSIPQLQALNVGKAISSDRKIVDDTFTLGFHLSFANQTDLNTYIQHPDHIQFVEQLKPNIKKIIVYDF